MILNGLTCNFIPKIETKESATVKATEHKANPATNEVHLHEDPQDLEICEVGHLK